MAEATMGGGQARPSLFLRNATGLVKALSTFDAFVYSFWSVNLITLGLYGMSFAYFVPDVQVLSAVLLTGVLVKLLFMGYVFLVIVMRRLSAGFVCYSSFLGRPLGFG